MLSFSNQGSYGSVKKEVLMVLETTHISYRCVLK